MTGGGSNGHLVPLSGNCQYRVPTHAVVRDVRLGLSIQRARPESGSWSILSWKSSLCREAFVSAEVLNGTGASIFADGSCPRRTYGVMFCSVQTC